MIAHSAGNDRDAGVVDEVCGYLTSTPPRSFFLFAGAGSGKTRTLVEVLRRLTGMVEHEVGSRFAQRLHALGRSIRVITYTRNAVAEIQGRLGENELTRVSTIHSFCWELIAGFDEDIREALLAENASDLDEAQQKAGGRKHGPTALDQRTIEKLREQAASLRSISRFRYNPDRNTYGEGALQHAQVLSVTTRLLGASTTLRRILLDRHPAILIDESQDTMKGMLGALMMMSSEYPFELTLGLIGDHRQRIYMDGHRDLPSLIPSDWALPELKMNHRSQRRIVHLINQIWDAELEGRTQPKTGVRQHERTEKSGGFVRIFVGDAQLPTSEKIRAESLCAEAMGATSGYQAWLDHSGGYQILALEHELAAARGGFLDVYRAMRLIDPDATRPQVNGDNAGPAAVQVLLDEAPALADCIDDHGGVDEFAVVEVLNRYDRLGQLPSDVHGQRARLAVLHEAVKEFAAVCIKPDSTVRDILEPVVRHELFHADERLVQALHGGDSPPEAPIASSDESTDDRRRRGLHDLLKVSWAEIGRYRSYREGLSSLATHQVVKGSEFEHVMVIMDDHEAGGFLFSYDKLFGAVSLSATDRSNVAENKETSIDRTLRLLYVTCSRARETLGLVLWSTNPEAALGAIKAAGWFSDPEIASVPGF